MTSYDVSLFAAWLANQGHAVLVFDYRGIGLSLSGPLKNSRASLTQWGQQDQVAALTFLIERSGSAQAVLVGHSAGGQMMGLMSNHAQLARVVGVAISSGWFSGMRAAFARQARFGLRVVMPLGSAVLGYAPAAWLGLGENLPRAVGRQWGQWCAAGGYASNAVVGKPEQDFHAQIRMPLTAFYAQDDDIANAVTVADLLRTFPNAHKQAVCVEPAQFGLAALGHIDCFRSSHQTVWPLLAAAVRGE